jgi:hypothetical protein
MEWVLWKSMVVSAQAAFLISPQRVREGEKILLQIIQSKNQRKPE